MLCVRWPKYVVFAHNIELRIVSVCYGNAPSHNSLIVRRFPYSSGSASCDFSLFLKLKKKLKVCYFDHIWTIQTATYLPSILQLSLLKDYYLRDPIHLTVLRIRFFILFEETAMLNMLRTPIKHKSKDIKSDTSIFIVMLCRTELIICVRYFT